MMRCDVIMMSLKCGEYEDSDDDEDEDDTNTP